jgi:hypothetical protein
VFYSYLLAVIPLWIACVCLCVSTFLIVRRLDKLSRSVASMRSGNERQFLGELRKQNQDNEPYAEDQPLKDS